MLLLCLSSVFCCCFYSPVVSLRFQSLVVVLFVVAAVINFCYFGICSSVVAVSDTQPAAPRPPHRPCSSGRGRNLRKEVSVVGSHLMNDISFIR